MRVRSVANAGNAHQPVASGGCPGQLSNVPIDRHDGGEDGGTRRNQTPHGSRQAEDALAGLQRLPDERWAQRTWQPDTKHHGKAVDLVLTACYSIGAFAVTRCDQRRRPMTHLRDIRSTPTSGASQAPTRYLSRVLCPEDERRNDTMDIGGWLRRLGLQNTCGFPPSRQGSNHLPHQR